MGLRDRDRGQTEVRRTVLGAGLSSRTRFTPGRLGGLQPGQLPPLSTGEQPRGDPGLAAGSCPGLGRRAGLPLYALYALRGWMSCLV